MKTRRVFFLMGAIFASIAPWLLVVSFSGALEFNYTVLDHAHAMLYGFAGALIVGYLLGKRSDFELILLAVIWGLGRIFETFTSQIEVTYVLYFLFGLVVAYPIASKFLVAKKATNLLMVPMFILIGGFPLIDYSINWVLKDKISLEALVLLITTLLFFMGGRVITPLLTKALKDNYQPIAHRVQPRLELATMMLLLASVVLTALNISTQSVALLCAFAALLIVVRIIRWEPYKVKASQGHLWALFSGYAMLAIGLVMYSVSLYSATETTSSLHIIMLGGLGALSTTIMLKTTYGRSELPNALFYVTASLMVVAGLARYVASINIDYYTQILAVSGLCWSVAYIITAVYIAKVPRRVAL